MSSTQNPHLLLENSYCFTEKPDRSPSNNSTCTTCKIDGTEKQPPTPTQPLEPTPKTSHPPASPSPDTRVHTRARAD